MGGTSGTGSIADCGFRIAKGVRGTSDDGRVPWVGKIDGKSIVSRKYGCGMSVAACGFEPPPAREASARQTGTLGHGGKTERFWTEKWGFFDHAAAKRVSFSRMYVT